jgi:hypothetical protein
MSFEKDLKHTASTRGLTRRSNQPFNQVSRALGNGRVDKRECLIDAELASNERKGSSQWYSIAGFMRKGPSSVGAGRAHLGRSAHRPIRF